MYEELGSSRAVAALVGHEHKIVKGWLERKRSGGSTRRRPRATDAYLPLIRAKLESSQGKIKRKPRRRSASRRLQG
jgi:hypothetical protein